MKKRKNISQTDIEDWQEYTKNLNDVADKEINTKNSYSKTKRFKFDLHGYSLLDANKKVKDLIIFCIKNNFKEILLVTGKGLHSNTEENTYVSKELSKLRYSIPDYIHNSVDLSKKIQSINTAALSDGGEGALIIQLK